MSVTLKLVHEEGLRLRQQSAHKVEHKDLTTGAPTQTVDWRFVKRPASDGKIVEECQQDEDARRVDSNGRKVQLGTYTLHITAGMNNLVIERKGRSPPTASRTTRSVTRSVFSTRDWSTAADKQRTKSQCTSGRTTGPPSISRPTRSMASS